MDILAEIRQKLLSGKQPVDLVKEDYAKSSVYYVANKLRRTAQTKMWGGGLTGDEVQELRRRKGIVKLEKEIAEFEAAKERLPERVARLEARLDDLRSALPKLVGHCYASLFAVTLAGRGQD